MIQRIQSVWLLIASISVLALLFIPIVVSQQGAVQYEITALGLFSKAEGASQQIETFIPLIILTILVALLLISSIFLFNNRRIQKRVISIAVLVLLGYSFLSSRYVNEIPGGIEQSSFGNGLYLPLVAIIFSMLAVRGINNDDKLIKSADRLR